MRLLGLTLSAVLLSGCSFVGGLGQKVGGVFNGGHGAHSGAYASQPRGYADPCQIPHAQAPVPRGCHPSQVSIGTGVAHPGGFPQQPQFGQPQYASGAYGSHASGNAHTSLHQGASAPQLRRPRFRGALDLGVERSVSGDALNYADFPGDPFAGYDPALYNEGSVQGSVPEGQVDTISYFANSRLQNTVDPWDEKSLPNVSLSDAWSVPATIGASGEFILNDRATLFARAGYTRAEGTSGSAGSIEATVFRRTVSEFYEENDAGAYVLVDTQTGTTFETGQTISEVSYDFSDLERIDLEAGGRYYFNPVAGQSTGQTVTPFVGASAGASHYNDASYTIDMRQISYESVYTEDTPTYYDVDPSPANPLLSTQVQLYDAQWVPTGRLNAGVEWQVTPGTALAVETGLRFEGAREYSNGADGDANITVPFTLRGSFNF